MVTGAARDNEVAVFLRLALQAARFGHGQGQRFFHHQVFFGAQHVEADLAVEGRGGADDDGVQFGIGEHLLVVRAQVGDGVVAAQAIEGFFIDIGEGANLGAAIVAEIVHVGGGDHAAADEADLDFFDSHGIFLSNLRF